MSINPPYLRDLVAVDADFKASVQLPFDFDNPAINERLVNSFIPTTQSIEILSEIAKSLDPNSTERARLMVGTFGTGKSDLLLMICNYFARQVDDPLMVRFYDRIRDIDPARAGIIKGRREGQPRFLVVLLQADTVSPFPGFVLHGLQYALEREGLAHLMNKTRYAAAREQIETWQRNGHARYADFCKTLEDHEGRDVTNLLSALSGPQADDALPQFLRTFKAVTDSDFHVYGYSQPHEAYADVAKALVATGNYSGILLVCDEFTAFLERFQGAIDQQLREFDAETKAVENLAERSSSSGRAPVHFIVASLESFASAAVTIGSGSVAKALERSGGRFKQHSLLVEGSEELIRGAIKQLPNADGVVLLPNIQRDDLLDIASEVWKLQGRSREWVRKIIVHGAFPLHPLSTYALPLINQKVAQSQRTMFLFLNDEKGLRGFIEREPLHDSYPGWHRLLTIDLLFDYFRESITTKNSAILEAFEYAEQQLRTATIDIRMSTRILKIVALCETVGSDLVMRPTKLFLRRALNLPPSAETDLDTALKVLEDVDAIMSPSDVHSTSGIYQLPGRGWISLKSLRQRIANRAQNLSITDVGKLQAYQPPPAIQATDYNIKRGSHRKLSAYYVGLNTLRSGERLKSDLADARNRDALLWYVVTTSDTERSEAQSLARELTAQQSRLVVAVPIAPSRILSALRDYQALEAVRNEVDEASKRYLEDTGKLGHEYKDRLTHELKLLVEARQWEWFAAGRGESGLASSNLVALSSLVMEKVFPDTPNTSLSQHFKPDDLGSTITKAVEQIIRGGIKLDKGAKSATDSVLRIGAVSLGLLQLDKLDGSFEPFSLADPKSSGNLASGKIWRRMSDHLAAGKPWTNLVRDLRQPPFGLYDSILIVFLAAFVARNADSVAITKVGAGTRAADIDPALLKAMLEKPTDYTIRYHLLSDDEKRWLRGIVERGLGQTDFNLPPGTTLRAAVATRVKAWLTRQQLPTFALSLSEEQITEALPDSDAVAIRAARLLLECQRNDGDIASLLQTELPQSLGAPAQHTAWNQTTVDALLGSWIAVCDVLTRLPVVLKERVVLRAAALFGAETVGPDARWGAIYRWRLTRGAIPSGRLQGIPQELFRFTNLVTGSIEQTLLNDFACRVVTVNVDYQRWQDLDKLEKVFSELTKARDAINQAWGEVADGDAIWREGLARVASGRVVSGVSAEQAATELAAWSTGITWPTCAQTLTTAQLHVIYPELSAENCHDLAHILSRADYDQNRWREDLAEVLPKAFAIQGWTRGEVNAALKRLETVLPIATSLESHLRRYVLRRIIQFFSASLAGAVAIPDDVVIAQWRDRYVIPEPNDLSAEAKGVLFHVGAGANDSETLVLTTLPRAISAVGKAVRQWERLDLLQPYEESLRRLIVEISSYEPVLPEVYRWLVGVLHALRRDVPTNLPHERQRLTNVVAAELSTWLREQRLPAFVADLSDAELAGIYPDADPQTLAALIHLLRRDAVTTTRMVISQDVPVALGLDSDATLWTEHDVERAREHLAGACRLIEALPCDLRKRLIGEMSQIFGSDTTSATSADLLTQMRNWRAAYVILPDDPLSPDARLLYDSLGGGEDDADGLLLQRLPARIIEVRAAYNNWSRWSTRENYLTALHAAAGEIVEHGTVGPGGERADALWREFRERLGALGDDERRWVVKTFRDEFQQ